MLPNFYNLDANLEAKQGREGEVVAGTTKEY